MPTQWFNRVITLTPQNMPSDPNFVSRSVIYPVFESPLLSDLVVEEFASFVALTSITEAPVIADDPLLSEAEKDALYYAALSAPTAQKKMLQIWIWVAADNKWHLLTEWLAVRRSPEYRDDLLSRITGKDTLILARGNAIGISVADLGSGLLGEGDSIRLWCNGYIADLGD